MWHCTKNGLFHWGFLQNPQFTADLLTFTEEIFNEKLHFWAVLAKEINKLTFKNNEPFRSCISKINNTSIYNVEDVDVVTMAYNLLEHSDKYSVTPWSLWNYFRDEVNDVTNKNNSTGNFRINNKKTITSKYLEYKTKVVATTPVNNSRLDTEVVFH